MAVNEQIYVTSLVKAINRAKRYGKFDTSAVILFNLYMHVINFAEAASANTTVFDSAIVYLKSELAQLMYKYPNELCNYKVVVGNDPGYPTVVATNVAPTVSAGAVDILTTSSYTFNVTDFLTDFADANNDSYKYLLVNPSGISDGSLSYNGVIITDPVIIDLTAYTTTLPLVYNRITAGTFAGDTFTFRVSDDQVSYLYSIVTNFVMSASAAESGANQPATIGDNTIYRPNRTTTVFTLADFTTGLTPPYNDPESDLIDAIRIDEISTANIGIFYFNGAPLQVNDIITREDLNAGLLIHIGPDQDAVSSDVFNFSARDEGSQTWVE